MMYTPRTSQIRFHYMMGYGNELSPVLGAPWIKTARHLLAGEVEDNRREGHDGSSAHAFKSKKGKKEKKPGDGLPEPSAPPNGTHSQL
jgi:acid phosphatase